MYNCHETYLYQNQVNDVNFLIEIEQKELRSELSKAGTAVAQSKNKISLANEKISEITQKPSFIRNQNKMRKANEVLFMNKDSSERSKELARDDLAALQSDEEFQKDKTDLTAAAKIKKESEFALENHTAKIEGIKKKLQ